MQLVGDDDDRLAVRLHVADDRKQPLGLLRGQHRRRLVKDQNIRAAVQHLDDLQRLFLAHRHFIDLLVQIQRKLVLFADGAGLVVDLAQVEFLTLVHGQRNVLDGGEHIHQLEMLMDHADAQTQRITGGTDVHRLLVHIDLAAVRVVDAGDHVHQGGLAAAVFAQQGQNFTAADVQGNVLVGNDLTKGFGDPFQPDGVLRLRHSAKLLLTF